MMEYLLTHKITPLLKCTILLLFIFTAKVLTSKPQDNQISNNSHYQKTPYVRTFTKYHHRRVPPEEVTDYWPLTDDNHVKVIKKRNADNFDSKELTNNTPGNGDSKGPRHTKDEKNGIEAEVKKYKVKAAIIVTDPPTTAGLKRFCLYKINNVELSVTPAYDDERNAQQMIENEYFDAPGPLSETVLHSGDQVQVEQCTDSRASCYTLIHQDSQGNLTILGQGCWRSSRTECNHCTRVTPRLPGTRFCCCTKDMCNADYGSLDDYAVTPIAESTTHEAHGKANMSHLAASVVLAIAAILVLSAILKRIFCKRTTIDKEEMSDGVDVEKADIMGAGPDALATGLSCVDNLTLIEHLGQGKFGSVWRGSLGSASVAVKLYSNAGTWQKEAAIYAMPHLSHQNLLRYYGSDTRPTLTEGGGREHLIVLELCVGTLRAALVRAPITWQQFAALAHGLSSALAHLHSVGSSKPCIVHRDVNSNNVLVGSDGTARLADLGLAQVVHQHRSQHTQRRVTEAGTLRYLAPEALEGALDLSGARAALCAVDVFALGLVLWEMLWRTGGAHAGPVPPYAQPYEHQGLTGRPSLAQMQSLVSRNKARPPLPKGPVSEGRALRVAADTCDECWDHDAEARLTAVCVEERMAELRQSLRAPPPRTHDNNLHPPRQHDSTATTQPETDKNSNCIVSQHCDSTTPLLYAQPHIGRNACIERNTHVTPISHTVELVHKSLKDVTTVPVETPRQQNTENCLSVARANHRQTFQDFENSDRLNEIRSYQRPLDYVQNDVSCHEERGPKQTNLQQDVKIEKPKWGIKKFLERRLSRNQKPLETEVKLVQDASSSVRQNPSIRTSIVNEKPCNTRFATNRPPNLVLDQDAYNFEAPCTLSPPNVTLSPTLMIESERNRTESRVFGFKELPVTQNDQDSAKTSQIFAVIVPKAKTTTDSYSSNLAESKTSKGSTESLKKSVKTSMSSQSLYKSVNSESEDSTVKKRLSCDNKIITCNISPSGRSSRASINLELQYITTEQRNDSFDNSECSSSEDEHLMLLSENGGSKITMQTIPKSEDAKKKYQNEVLKESTQAKGFANKHNPKYKNFDNEFSDPNDKENLLNTYSGDNPVYLAALNGEIDTNELKYLAQEENKSPKPTLKNLAIKRQHSLEQVGEIFSSTHDLNLQNPAGRVKTPGDLPVAIRKARRDRALQKGRSADSNRLSLYDDRMMFGNSL